MKKSIVLRAMLALLVVMTALVPFINKAFHIDDPLFLWMAQQILHHPWNPYGFSVNWYLSAHPMSVVMQNPPLNSYYIALIGSMFGWKEPVMHAAFLLPASAAAIGTLFLARHFSPSPLVATMLTILTPVFLVSATTIMCDVWLLVFWVWAIYCWIRGLEHRSWWLLVFASLLATAAAFTKYFGLSLVPLLVVFTLARDRRWTSALLFLLIPLLAIALYEIVTKAKYGNGLVSSALVYPSKMSRPDTPFLKSSVTGLAFAGGCFISCLFYAPLLKRRGLLAGTAIFIALLTVVYFLLAPGMNSRGAVTLTFEGALFVITAIGIFALAISDLARHKTAESLLLCLWVGGTFFFATYLNWAITARTFLPMTPAVAILLTRRLSLHGHTADTGAALWFPLLPATIISLLIVIGDYRLANNARFAAAYFQERFHAELGSVWFQGHWGFQYYMEQGRAKAVDVRESRFFPGDVLITPLNNTNLAPLGIRTMAFPQQVQLASFPIATMSAEAGAGFYLSQRGPLPWAFGFVPPERYNILRVE